MMKMKKNSARMTPAVLMLTLVAGMTACGTKDTGSSSVPPTTSSAPSTSQSTAPAATPEETAKRFEDAITNARDDEMNQYNPVMTNGNRADRVAAYMKEVPDFTEATAGEKFDADLQMLTTLLGFAPADAEAYAISASMMNIKAYAIAVVKPAAGKEEAIQKALGDYITAQKKSFESYLQDQKAVADAAILKTLDDGTVVMVMSENQDTVYESIVANLK